MTVPATAQAIPNGSTPAPLLHKIHKFVKKQHRWAYWGYSVKRTYHHSAERTQSSEFRKWVLDEWKSRAHKAYNHYLVMSALTRDWACIHSYEGAWNANTGNGYYGGLQMDIPFQLAYNPRAYAAYGTADNWPISEQVVAARRAYAVRGYSPWPLTAAMCGLL